MGTRAVSAARRPRRVTEAPEYLAMLGRMVAAYARRVGDGTGDIEALSGLAELSAQVEAAMAASVAGLRASGHSWTEVGRVLGITRQAAQQRFSRAAQDHDPGPHGGPGRVGDR